MSAKQPIDKKFYNRFGTIMLCTILGIFSVCLLYGRDALQSVYMSSVSTFVVGVITLMYAHNLVNDNMFSFIRDGEAVYPVPKDPVDTEFYKDFGWKMFCFFIGSFVVLWVSNNSIWLAFMIVPVVAIIFLVFSHTLVNGNPFMLIRTGYVMEERREGTVESLFLCALEIFKNLDNMDYEESKIFMYNMDKKTLACLNDLKKINSSDFEYLKILLNDKTLELGDVSNIVKLIYTHKGVDKRKECFDILQNAGGYDLNSDSNLDFLKKLYFEQLYEMGYCPTTLIQEIVKDKFTEEELKNDKVFRAFPDYITSSYLGGEVSIADMEACFKEHKARNWSLSIFFSDFFLSSGDVSAKIFMALEVFECILKTHKNEILEMLKNENSHCIRRNYESLIIECEKEGIMDISLKYMKHVSKGNKKLSKEEKHEIVMSRVKQVEDIFEEIIGESLKQ